MLGVLAADQLDEVLLRRRYSNLDLRTRDPLPTYRYMKQITRNEVRLTGFRILTIPVRGVVWTDAGYKPVKQVWRSLLQQLNAKRDAMIAEKLARKPNPKYAGIIEALTGRKGRASRKERLANLQRHYPEPRIPKVYSDFFNPIKCEPTTCRVCGKQFYLAYRARQGWYGDPSEVSNQRAAGQRKSSLA